MNKRFSSRYIVGLFWLVVAVAIALYMHIKHRYHFPFIEQSQMFLFDKAYIVDKLCQVAGVATLVEEFFTQFFVLPFVGPLFVAVALVAVGLLARSIVKRVAPTVDAPLVWLLPVALQLYTMVDYDYQYSGIIAYIMALATFRLYIAVADWRYKTLLASVLALVLYWFAGPAALMFVLGIVAYELCSAPRWGVAYSLIPMVVVAAAGWVAVYYMHLVGEVRYAFLPDLYYKPMLRPSSDIYYAWAVLPLICAVAPLLRRCKEPKAGLKRVVGVAQIVCVALLVVLLGKDKEYLQPSVTKFKEMDYHLRFEQWDDLLALSREQGVDNALHIMMQNIALIQKDALGDEAFAYTQAGLDGITMDWSDNNPFIFSMLSDLHFALGNTSISQEVAFKKNSESIAVNHSYNPRMLKRLIQTNIIYGGESGYAVAEKYISILEKSLFYAEWATAQRALLGNDDLLEPMMLEQRVNMHNIDLTYKMDGNFDILGDVAHCNLSRRTFHHQCAGYLLNMDLERFYQIVSRLYGTESMPTLPKSFAEALLIYAAQNQLDVEGYSIDENTKRSFMEFQTFAAKNYNNRNLASIMRKSYSETYWYYYMFTK
ncbi:MAG: hypothetical protein IKY82_06755 [Alistipes sp.]|nr:hypothetical protein [Alistipes sp.]